MQRGQCIVARKPNDAQTIDHGGNNNISWHVVEVLFGQPLLGIKSLVIVRLHLSIIYAKRAQAGPLALQEAIDAAIKACVAACRPSLDIARGLINMARWRKGDSAL